MSEQTRQAKPILEDGRRKYLKVAEVAEHLGLGVSTVYDLIDRGDLKAKKFGRSTRVHVDALRRYEEESDCE